MRHMVVIVPELTGYASIRHVAVSLPYVGGLVDGVKYMELADIKPPEGDTERRRQQRARSLRFLVMQALRRDSAEQLGKKLRRRYQRQQQRQAVVTRPDRRDGSRLDRERLERLLAD